MGNRSICTCSGCGAKIIWMTTPTGKMMPVDYKPELDMVEEFDSTKMVSHFSTCSRAGDFRKKKEQKTNG